MNLIENLGLEKCQAIVDGAQDLDVFYDLVQQKYISQENVSILMAFISDRFIEIYGLLIAIAEHGYTDHCTDIGYHLSPLTGVIER